MWMFVDPKSFFLALLMLLELTKKVSEQSLVEKKVHGSLKIDNNFKIFPPKRFAIKVKKVNLMRLFLAFEDSVI